MRVQVLHFRNNEIRKKKLVATNERILMILQSTRF